MKKIIMSALLIMPMLANAASYIMRSDAKGVSAEIFVGGVCEIKFTLNQGSSYGAVLRDISVYTKSGRFNFGERISHEKLKTVYDNATVLASSRYNNSNQYYPGAAIAGTSPAGETAVWLGIGGKDTFNIIFNNPINMTSISYSDHWFATSASFQNRSSKDYTIEAKNCNGEVIAQKYISGTLGSQYELGPFNVVLE